jgi:hypothetical protein
MTISEQSSRRSIARQGLVRAAGAAAFAAAALLGTALPTARAATPANWQEACGYRMPSGIPGNGHSILADYCRRLTFCKAMDEQGKPGMMTMGCVGYGAAPRRN